MTRRNRIPAQSIYYFDQSNTEQFRQNSLKEFIYFLKYKGVSSHIDFCYSNEEDSLHCHLSIKENLILDAVPTSLIKDNENNLNEFIHSIRNTYLKSLIVTLGDLSKTVNKLNSEKLKLTSIVKTILSQSTYMFFEKPEKGLSPELLEVVKKCIQFEVKNNNRVVMIKSSQKLLWPKMITNIVTKDDKNQFTDTLNPLHEKSSHPLDAPKYTFTLNKKAS